MQLRRVYTGDNFVLSDAMNIEYSDQSKENQVAIIKQCQICDFPMAEAESYCHHCGALWCKNEDNPDAQIIRLFDPQDVTQYTVMPLLTPSTVYPVFSLA